MGSGFKLITDAALREYRATLDWYGHTEDDFELKEQFDAPPKADIQQAWGFVIVTRKSTGVCRHYRASRALRWTDGFEQDMTRRIFSRR